MSAKKGSWILSLVSGIFGSILAPVLVNLTSQEVTNWIEGQKATSPKTELVRVVTRGMGATPEDARRDAVRQAVRIVAARVNEQGAAFDEATLRYEDFAADIEDLGSDRIGGTCRQEAAVTVAAGKLADAGKSLRAGAERRAEAPLGADPIRGER